LEALRSLSSLTVSRRSNLGSEDRRSLTVSRRSNLGSELNRHNLTVSLNSPGLEDQHSSLTVSRRSNLGSELNRHNLTVSRRNNLGSQLSNAKSRIVRIFRMRLKEQMRPKSMCVKRIRRLWWPSGIKIRRPLRQPSVQ
jgi:hypothetical protein